MLAQRGAIDAAAKARVADKAAEERAASPAPTSASNGAKRKLSFKEKHALETLPKQIEAWSAEAAQLQTRMEEPGLYARDRATFEATSAKVGTLRAKIAAAEDDWIALELLKSELEG